MCPRSPELLGPYSCASFRGSRQFMRRWQHGPRQAIGISLGSMGNDWIALMEHQGCRTFGAALQ